LTGPTARAAARTANQIRSTPTPAATAALNGTASGTPKTRDGRVEAIRALRVVRRGAVKARTQAMNQLKGLIVTAPADLRETLRGLPTAGLIATCARLRPHVDGRSEAAVISAPTKPALRHLARRYQQLSQEIAVLDAELHPLVQAAAPALLELPGVGPEVAGQLLASAGDNPDRLRSEAAFATSAVSSTCTPSVEANAPRADRWKP